MAALGVNLAAWFTEDDLRGKPQREITLFRGRYAALSNFSDYPVQFEGFEYRTAEHAFQAAKTLDAHQRRMIRDTGSPTAAKRRGKKVTLRDGWDDGLSYAVMRQVVTDKFLRNEEAGDVLADTTGYVLIEGNDRHDNIWGDCRCGRPDCSEPGKNYLGHILMEVRDGYGW